MVLNGVLDRFPDIRLILSHLGGATHYLLERICQAGPKAQIERPVIEYYREMHYDTGGPVSSSAVRCAIDLFGAEQIVHGTDYPFGPSGGREFIDKASSCVRDLSLPRPEEEAIFSGNAKKILGL